MARRSIITREVSASVATVLAVELSTNTVSTVEITLPTVYTDAAKALTYIQKHNPPQAGTVYAAVTALNTRTTMLGMWLEDFIAHAMTLDPTTRKPIGCTDDTEES